MGGIKANNDHPVEFLLENLRIQNNLISAAHENGVRKLLFLGSSCIYPKLAPQPIPESALLGGPLEPTNEAYAIAKIAGIKLCQAYAREYGANFISAMPTNLYGPNDNFDLETSHVLPRSCAKRTRRKWPARARSSSGARARRGASFSTSTIWLRPVFSSSRITTPPKSSTSAAGADITIRELAELICEVVGFEGELTFDATKPDGTPRKLLDISKLTSFGWHPSISLRDGIARTYDWFKAHR